MTHAYCERILVGGEGGFRVLPADQPETRERWGWGEEEQLNVQKVKNSS